ncbi:RNA polymerase-associated protein RTF1 homolog [Paramacrobiotus metropolitanus]|uniref:RNA polymerase-associated protein RTF1 homolog n=1 Tax=Paramacrobiotus metropolitanus TaxID=2943436 RepID=UPI002445F99C|nr:RNA polymerase-associated protein RTF1 homolog [Paramacrobiotus metropolitanus]XP_055337572.1 RNA polymerase-associated protein RTF1 homolog [Paramacrobiotus metropolitanus]
MPQGSENLRMAGFKPDGTKDEQIKYFRDLVAQEVSFENSLAEQWQKKLKESGPGSSSPTITEDGADQIHLAIGQSRLFLDKKMQQFVGLLDECEMGNTTTTPTDLAGFWEMLYMELKNIHDRFEHLDVLAVNGWMTLPTKKTVFAADTSSGSETADGDHAISDEERKNTSSSTSDSLSDGCCDSVDNQDVERKPNYQEVEKILIKRDRLIGWQFFPFFEDTVKGCFVRVYHSVLHNVPTHCDTIPEENLLTDGYYKIGKIVGVGESKKPYSIILTDPPVPFYTRVTLNVKFGNHEEEVLLRNVSNGITKECEYTALFNELERYKTPWPTKTFLEKKEQDLQRALTALLYPTSAHVAYCAEQYNKFPRRHVTMKDAESELSKLRDAAALTGDQESAARFQSELSVLIERKMI